MQMVDFLQKGIKLSRKPPSFWRKQLPGGSSIDTPRGSIPARKYLLLSILDPDLSESTMNPVEFPEGGDYEDNS